VPQPDPFTVGQGPPAELFLVDAMVTSATAVAMLCLSAAAVGLCRLNFAFAIGLHVGWSSWSTGCTDRCNCIGFTRCCTVGYPPVFGGFNQGGRPVHLDSTKLHLTCRWRQPIACRPDKPSVVAACWGVPHRGKCFRRVPCSPVLSYCDDTCLARHLHHCIHPCFRHQDSFLNPLVVSSCHTSLCPA